MNPREEQRRSASSSVQVVELLVPDTGQDWGHGTIQPRVQDWESGVAKLT
jgi:hypothetical protein